MDQSKCVPPFKSHMSAEEAQKLQIGDKIDHRVRSGMFYPAIIIARDESKGTIKIHHIGQSTKEDDERSYIKEYYGIAKYLSISTRPAHRLKDIKMGSFVDICLPTDSLWKNGQVKGWIKGKVIKIPKMKNTTTDCAQISVIFDIGKGMNKQSYVTFIHRDNANEIDRFGIHTNCKQINHIPIAMETKRVYLNTPNEIKQDCAKAIINNVYGGMENILSYLIKNAATSQLQEMKKIIKQKNIKYLDTKKSEKQNQKNDKSEPHLPKEFGSKNIKLNKSVKPKISSLCELSRESIINICGYLNKDDIKSFKLTSFRNGMICLREMTKYNIAIFNTNEFINHNNNKNSKYIDALGFMHTMTAHVMHKRYCVNTKYLALRQIWEEKYNIPLSQQLLFLRPTVGHCAVFDTERNDQSAEESLDFVPRKAKFILFDKRNLIQLDSTNKPKPVNTLQTTKQSLILLKWFDVFEQEIIPLQFIIGSNDIMTIGRLITYMENEFIVTTQQQKVWYSKLKLKFIRMNSIAPYHQKLIVHKEYDMDNAIKTATNPIEQVPWWQPLIFQFNPTHPTFAKKKFATIQEKINLLKQ